MKNMKYSWVLIGPWILVCLILPAIIVQASSTENFGDLSVCVGVDRRQRIVVGGEPDIRIKPAHPDFAVSPSTSTQDIFITETTSSLITTINLTYYPSEPVWIESQGYDVFLISSCEGFTTNPGEPTLPLRTISILLPPQVQVSTELLCCERTAFEGDYNIFPAQRPQVNMSDYSFTPPSPGVYSLDCLWPSEVFEIVGFRQIREYRLLVVKLFPLSYIPRQKRVIFNRALEISISFENNFDLVSSFKKSEMFDNAVKNLVVNPDDMSRFYISDGEETDQSSPGPFKYVIVTPEGFEAAAQQLADWKTSRGVNAGVFTIEYITSTYSAIDVQEKIRNFLIDCYNSWGTEWVLLAGDVAQVPSRMVYCPDGYDPDGDYVPCDYYYADLTGDWDSNGNGLWGETSDQVNWEAEVVVGRLPAQTSTELINIVSKIMSYEQSPPAGDWTSRMLLAGAYSNYENEDNKGWAKTDEAKLKELIGTNLLPDSYSYIRLYEKAGVDPSDYYCELPLTEENVETELNSGYLLANFAGHGSDYGIYRKVWVSDSNSNGIPESSEMSWYNMITKSTSFSNDMKLFLAYGDACSSAQIDVSESFGEYIVKLSDGAIGYIGATRVSWYGIGWNLGFGYNQELDYRFWHDFFEPSVEMRPGAALYLSKLWYANIYDTTVPAHRKDLFTYLLLGDPEIKMLARKADMIIEDISWSPTEPYEEDLVTYTVYIKNQGDVDAGSFVVTYGVNGLKLGEWAIGGLSAGTTLPRQFIGFCQDKHTVWANADAYNDVSETNEDNNYKEEVVEIWARYTPTPDQIELEVGKDGSVSVIVIFNIPHDGFQVEWGSVDKLDSLFTADANVWEWTGVHVLVIPPPLGHTYNLGVLSDGDYRFIFKAWGMTVEEVSFIIGITIVISVEDQTYASYIQVNVTVWSGQEHLNTSVHARFLWGPTEVGFTSTTVDIPSGIGFIIPLPPWDSLNCFCPIEVIGENITVSVTLKSSEGETLASKEATFTFMQPDKELLWERLVKLVTAWPTASPGERDGIWEKIVKIVTLYPTAP